MDGTSWINKIYEKNQRNKDHARKRSVGWNITCSATGFDCRSGCTQDRVCILLPSPPASKGVQTQAGWISRGCVTNPWSPPARPQRRPSPSCTQLCYAAIPEHKGKRRCHQQVTSLSTRITDAAAGVSALGCWCWAFLLKETGWARGKLVNISRYSRPR